VEGCYSFAYPWKAELIWVAGYILRLFTWPKTVTHPSTNQAQRRATVLIERNVLLCKICLRMLYGLDAERIWSELVSETVWQARPTCALWEASHVDCRFHRSSFRWPCRVSDRRLHWEESWHYSWRTHQDTESQRGSASFTCHLYCQMFVVHVPLWVWAYVFMCMCPDYIIFLRGQLSRR